VLYPFTFHPIFKERVWGGRRLEELYRKSLPPGAPIGESWEISDRPDDASVISNGPLAGKDLHWLMQNHAAELLGPAGSRPLPKRFPLLIKILDARDRLSLQVHPPPDKAAKFGGEPKTELWYVADANPDAELYAGLKKGVTREQFTGALNSGTVANCFHRLSVRAGDSLFLPSGRVHAIGAGLVIFEIQQNSDTTFRVFDWNRVGLDGKPRALHVAESLESIDFEDFEPRLSDRVSLNVRDTLETRTLAAHSLFHVELLSSRSSETLRLDAGTMRIFGVVRGRAEIHHVLQKVHLQEGYFSLVPACVSAELVLEPATTVLHIRAGSPDVRQPSAAGTAI